MPCALLLLAALGCGGKSDVPQPPEPRTAHRPVERASEPVRRAMPEPPAGPLPRFTEVSQPAGVDFVRYDDIRGLHRILESNGGGVALFDYDGDGRLDVFFTNGCTLPLRTRDDSHSNELYRNLGDGRFAKATLPAGLRWSGYCHGCAVADYDGDGFDDLYVTAFGRNALFRNNGDGTFSDVTDSAGADSPLWSSSVAFADVNLDGHPDLYVVNYVDTGDDPPRLCPEPASPDGYLTCPPTVFRAAEDVLFLSDGQGAFVDATRPAGIVGVDGKGLGVAVFDADGDGLPDIYVANDGMPNFLYLNRTPASGGPDSADDTGPRALPRMPRFVESAPALGAAVNRHGKAEASMGIAYGDIDGDGRPDLFLTHFHAETNTLYRNLGGGAFADETNASGLGPPSRALLGFGTEFFDADNNGRLDLFVANGHIDDLTWGPTGEPYRMPPQMFRNEGDGRFAEVSRWSGDYFLAAWLGRGVAVGDLDNDGDLDLVVSHQLDRSAVLRNDTPSAGGAVVVKLVGLWPSNRSAIHARIEADGPEGPLFREVLGGASYQSSSDRRLHVGLGTGDSVRLRVTWPSGRRDEWPGVPAGHYIAVEGRGLFRMPAELTATSPRA